MVHSDVRNRVWKFVIYDREMQLFWLYYHMRKEYCWVKQRISWQNKKNFHFEYLRIEIFNYVSCVLGCIALCILGCIFRVQSTDETILKSKATSIFFTLQFLVYLYSDKPLRKPLIIKKMLSHILVLFLGDCSINSNFFFVN
jgi:hypothetical protein